MLFDGSANPSAVTTDDTLLEAINKNGGVDTSPNTHGRSKVPSTATISSEPEESKENPLHEDEQTALKGLSAGAKDVYRLVRDKLAGSSNKKVTHAASVGAVPLARHADIIACKIRTAVGKPFTAMDYYRNMFALKTEGDKRGANALHQAANAGGKMYAQSARDVPSAEKEAVRKQYEGTEQWMKAPNGKPMNLTEDQWVAVRTPAFNAWFGDWEAEAEKQKYLNTAPINVTEKKITKSGGVTARDAAFAWADAYLPVQVSTRFGEVEINRTSVKDSLGHGFSQKKLDAITSLPEGMKVAAFIGEAKDFNGADIDNGYFCYPIMYQGEKQVVFCRARRDVNSNKIYVHEVWTEDEIRGIPLQTAAKFSNSKPHGGNTLYKSILADFLNKGNKCSKIVDENASRWWCTTEVMQTLMSLTEPKGAQTWTFKGCSFPRGNLIQRGMERMSVRPSLTSVSLLMRGRATRL